MSETPKRQKRKLKEDSPSGFYPDRPVGGAADFEETSVTYEFHPTESAKLRKGDPSSNSFGKRPKCFIKSPSLRVRAARKAVQNMTPSHDKELECEKLFKGLLHDSEKENHSETSELTESKKDSSNQSDLSEEIVNKSNDGSKNEMSLLDDSSGDALFLLSQTIENEVEKSSHKSRIKPSLLPVGSRSKHVKDMNDPSCKRSYRNQIEKQVNRIKKTTNKDHHYLRQSSNSSEAGDSTVSLLEDGNDAGFFDLDEKTIISQSCTVSSISYPPKCTPEEIEAKRKEALKKLQEKKMKTVIMNNRFRSKCSNK